MDIGYHADMSIGMYEYDVAILGAAAHSFSETQDYRCYTSLGNMLCRARKEDSSVEKAFRNLQTVVNEILYKNLGVSDLDTIDGIIGPLTVANVKKVLGIALSQVPDAAVSSAYASDKLDAKSVAKGAATIADYLNRAKANIKKPVVALTPYVGVAPSSTTMTLPPENAKAAELIKVERMKQAMLNQEESMDWTWIWVGLGAVAVLATFIVLRNRKGK